MKLNKELLEMLSPKDLEIAQLKRAIEAFKKYDAERSKYLQKIQLELEDVSQRYVDLKKTMSMDVVELVQEYQKKIKDLKSTLKGQMKSIEHLKTVIELMRDDEKREKAEDVFRHYTVVQLKEKNDKLQKELNSIRNTNRELIVKIVQLNKQNKETEK